MYRVRSLILEYVGSRYSQGGQYQQFGPEYLVGGFM
jgi:hypothetical protein